VQVSRRLCVYCVWWALLAPAAISRAQPVRDNDVGSQLDVAGGYDSNPTLALDPNARRVTTTTGPGPGGVLHAIGNAYAVLGDVPWLGVAFNTDARLYHSADVRHDSALSMFAGTEVGSARLSFNAAAGRYDASFGSDDAWYGSLAPAFRWSFSERLSLGLEAHADLRRYAGGDQTNGDLGSAVELQVRQDTWIASLGVDVDRRRSSDESAIRTQATPFASLVLLLDDWSLSVRYAAFARWFDLGEQDGVEHTAELLTRYRLGSLMSLSARVGSGIADGQIDALRYERWYALVGLGITLGGDSRALAIEPDRTRQGAALVSAGTTRFEVCVAGAREVAVVGTFNAWSESAGRMQRTTGECFAIELVVRAGHHRYQWLIDGALARPDGAPAYTSDGFGGEDAVLIVPQ